jgi:hypothetical protein
MSKQRIDLDIVCQACTGTGLYIGLAERDGTAVVCSACKGTGKYAYRFTYEPFVERKAPPKKVKSVHVARGYVIAHDFDLSDGGLPIERWKPGMTVPADEKLYCPWNYVTQEWCAHPDKNGRAPFPFGLTATSCPYWEAKAECWERFHAEAPARVRRQVS